jgi:hypothetical protein
MYAGIWLVKMMEKGHLEGLDIDGRVWTFVMWFKILTSARLL